MDIIALVQSYINIKAVFLAVALTQLIKYYLPSAIPGERTTEVVPGRLSTRLLPLVPVIIGFIVTFFLERDTYYSLDDGIRGVMSGITAAYSYRTTQVSFFGA